MKPTLFCECNSEWITGYTELRQTQKDFQVCHGYGQCPTCLFNKWLNPQYENHMFDLKEMNK